MLRIARVTVQYPVILKVVTEYAPTATKTKSFRIRIVLNAKNLLTHRDFSIS